MQVITMLSHCFTSSEKFYFLCTRRITIQYNFVYWQD